MILENTEMLIGDRKIVFRSAGESDAEALLVYLKAIAGETPYLLREPEEAVISLETEKAFIREKESSGRELVLLAFENGRHIGNCSISSSGNFSRYAHRCSIAIALYQKYCRIGIGRKMLELVLEIAKNAGYEQAELEVAASNYAAIRLYEKLGFQKYGTMPDNMKYKDGTYEDVFWMMKKL